MEGLLDVHGVLPEELEQTVWAVLLELLPHDPVEQRNQSKA